MGLVDSGRVGGVKGGCGGEEGKGGRQAEGNCGVGKRDGRGREAGCCVVLTGGVLGKQGRDHSSLVRSEKTTTRSTEREKAGTDSLLRAIDAIPGWGT